MRVKYLCKRILENGVTTGYKIGPIVNGNYTPKGHDILYGDKKYLHKKVEKVDGVWKVVEDKTAKSSALLTTAEKAGVLLDAKETKKQLKTILTDIDKLKSLADAKVVLRKFAKVITYLIYELKED